MKKALKLTGLFFSILITVLYLISCLTPYISPEHFSAATLFSLAYLPLLIVYVLTIAIWFFVKKKTALLLFILLFAGYKNFGATIAFNIIHSKWKPEKDKNSVRVMCWNVNYLGNPWIISDTPGARRRKLIEYIGTIQPDILCVQDFYTIEAGTAEKSFRDNVNELYAAGKFLQHYFSYVYEYDGTNYCDKTGVAIFSKFPIADTGSFSTDGHRKAGKAGYIDLLIDKKMLRIYVAHLSSMQLWPNTSGDSGIDYVRGDSTKKRVSTILSKLNYYDKVHAREAKVIKKELNKSPYPFLFSGDLNSVPSGYVYHTLKKGLKDAFLEKDLGVGGTYNRVFPKLRIDVLLHSKETEVTQYNRPAINLSDHYPIIADIRWKK